MHIHHVSIPNGESPNLAGMILQGDNLSASAPVMLVIHGWTSQMARYPSRVAPMIEKMGYKALLFDMRGHGETGGDLDTLSPSDHLDDCLVAYDYMMQLDYIDSENISVFGSSYGGYLASLVSAKRLVHHMAFNVPALYGDDIFERPKMQTSQQTTEYRKLELDPEENMALQAVRDFEGDLLLIEAEHDEQVHPQVMKNYRNAAREGYDYVLIEGADHSMKSPGTEKARNQALEEWFERLM